MIKITAKELKQLVDFVRINYGLNLAEKETLIITRLHNILAKKNFNSFSEYYNYIATDVTGEAVTTLMSKLTTNHSFFLREQEHFDFFQNHILPYFAKRVFSHNLGIWSAGCATGEEPYTLAMIIDDFFGPAKSCWDTQILATDISKMALDTATTGIYTHEQLDTVPEKWRNTYFKKIRPDQSVICDQIKREVIFRIFNLNNEVFPFKRKFHIIFCRNVMIYFDPVARKNLIDRFYQFTEPGGYLFIGQSESLRFDETKYQYVMPAVYRKEE
ncbi:MAG TPA: protein-glutamate O-methyltransferase CheR [Bacillota bacterium]|nr:protein-glutamate O-methyltransferase CheR [Bacillota bacterium]